MKLFCISHSYHYEIENVIRLFLPFQKILVLKEREELSGDYLYTEKQEENGKITLISEFSFGGKEQKSKTEYFNINDNDTELYLAGMVLEQFINEFNFKPNWGIVTGVRPSKLMASVIDEVGEENAKEHFIKKFLVKPNKAEMAFNVAKMEEKIIKSADGDSFSLYISIPYCPTRCSYCSFVSHSISNEKARDLIPQYVEKLCEELKVIAEIAKNNELYLKSVYWGGGTPTTLTHEQLDTILTEIEKDFDLTECIEYTVEAGRPDTITKEKLEVLKKHNVNRISINPQTFNNSVLNEIGRRHSAEDAIEKYNMARETGFDSINMDLIAGLDGEKFKDFKKSLNTCLLLNPTDITVHTLSVKNTSNLKLNGGRMSNAKTVSKMVSYASNTLANYGYNPYYLYRQKNMVGNHENIGYTRDMSCVFNIISMEELASVVACGANAISKKYTIENNRIDRFACVKNINDYITRIDELIEKKINLFKGDN